MGQHLSLKAFSTTQGQHLVQHLLQVAMTGSFSLVMPVLGTIAATCMLKEEWRYVSTERLEQSVMWAGTSWMPKWLVANLA